MSPHTPLDTSPANLLAPVGDRRAVLAVGDAADLSLPIKSMNDALIELIRHPAIKAVEGEAILLQGPPTNRDIVGGRRKAAKAGARASGTADH